MIVCPVLTRTSRIKQPLKQFYEGKWKAKVSQKREVTQHNLDEDLLSDHPSHPRARQIAERRAHKYKDAPSV